jgi:hypothetical protein
MCSSTSLMSLDVVYYGSLSLAVSKWRSWENADFVLFFLSLFICSFFFIYVSLFHLFHPRPLYFCCYFRAEYSVDYKSNSDSLRAGRSGDRISVGGEIFRTCADRLCCPPSLLYYEYRVSFLGVKRPGSGVNHPPPSSAEVKERVELYLYSPSGPSWPGLGRTWPFTEQYWGLQSEWRYRRLYSKDVVRTAASILVINRFV